MYTSFYGLKEEPFRLTPDPRFLHLARPHRDALITLLRGILRRQGTVSLTGEVGTGKTTLLHSLFTIMSRKLNVASAFIVNPTVTRDELLEYILQELEIDCPYTTKPRRLLALQRFLIEMQHRGTTTVLVIDEAHLMSVELLQEVRLLCNADGYSEKLLQLILCGQPELQHTLAEPDLRALNQRIALWVQLQRLNASETRAYIAERLRVAGLRALSPFSVESVEQIYRHTGGVPRLINQVCDGCLVLGFVNKRKLIEPNIVVEAARSLRLELECCTNNTADEVERMVNQIGARQ